MNSEIEKFEKEGYIEPFKIINNGLAVKPAMPSSVLYMR